MGFFTATATAPFGVAAFLLIGLVIVELVGLLFAQNLSAVLDDLIPDGSGHGLWGDALAWLHIGQVPALVLLMLFLTGFSVGGYALQQVSVGVAEAYLPALLASLAALPFGILSMRLFGASLGRLFPRDETSAVSDASFIGRGGVISGGSARSGFAAQAQVRDHHNRMHYLMVEPDREGEEFAIGTPIIIVHKQGAFYRAIRDPQAPAAFIKPPLS
ncbi:YqiJ family protein [Elstera cyanobacteriorum]|uniref:YqiJ family protein n=1 Tax=Elstera cyanobacteriorum TaxID=2022747 RepID=UPI002355B795|nr:YqiJ family protein [Elstera cyanobacteriorum]MCK6443401.1 YqiJ family protein [Elstera cyanobacteriorum]